MGGDYSLFVKFGEFYYQVDIRPNGRVPAPGPEKTGPVAIPGV
jgi:hypothetical protein